MQGCERRTDDFDRSYCCLEASFTLEVNLAEVDGQWTETLHWDCSVSMIDFIRVIGMSLLGIRAQVEMRLSFESFGVCPDTCPWVSENSRMLR